MRAVSWSMAVLLVMAVPVLAEDAKSTVKTATADPPTELAAAIRSVLGNDSIQVIDDKGVVWATFWFRKSIPSIAAEEQVKNGLTYREITPSTVVGAVKFEQAWSDFRKQKIPAGVYTLRMAVQPMDGDHQGTAPYQEFCLVCPASKDHGAAEMDLKELVELSANAPGGTHPGVMLLFPNNKPADTPAIGTQPGKIALLSIALNVVASGKPAKLGFSFVIAGHTQE